MRVRSLRFSVIGTGLIGGSLLNRLVDTGTDVIGWDTDEATAVLAADRGLPFTTDLAAAVTGRDIVFLAAPLSALPSLLEHIAPYVGPETVVTDVGSTKTDIAAAAAASALAARFIPGHPMAGTEKSGLVASDANLFDAATWVLCPGDDVPLERVRKLIYVVTTIFDAHVTVMTPARHDEVVALSSHIPHLLAGALAGAVGRSDLTDAVLGLAAGSFRDGTRVAGTPPKRTVDMLAHNADAVARRVRDVQHLLTEMVDAAEEGDTDRLIELFSEAAQVRQRLLNRGRTSASREFAEAEAEREFLAATGLRGTCVTGCRIERDHTVYSTLE